MGFPRDALEAAHGLLPVAIGAEELQVGKLPAAAVDMVDFRALRTAAAATIAVSFEDSPTDLERELPESRVVASGEDVGEPDSQGFADIGVDD